MTIVAYMELGLEGGEMCADGCAPVHNTTQREGDCQQG